MKEKFYTIGLIPASSCSICDYSIQTDQQSLINVHKKLSLPFQTWDVRFKLYALTFQVILLGSVLPNGILVHSLQKPIKQK